MPVRRIIAAVLLLAASQGGCGKSHAKTPACTTDDQCTPTDLYVCMNGACLPRATGRTLAVEILPPNGSASAQTELLGITLTSGQLTLAADDKTTVVGTVHHAAQDPYSAQAHVKATIASRIPGRANLQLETDMAGFAFALDVGTSRLGTNAAVLFIPNPQTPGEPTIPLTVQLEPEVTLTFPLVSDLTTLRGQVLDASSNPLPGFTAQVLWAGQPVSNVTTTDDTGSFSLLVPPGAVSLPPNDLVSLSISNADPTANSLQLMTSPTSLKTLAAADPTAPAPVYLMPPYAVTPGPVEFFVQPATPIPTDGGASDAVDGGVQALSDVSVRFRTTLAAPSGTAVYVQRAVSDGSGAVAVPLIAAAVDVAQDYQIAIQPPPGTSEPASAYAAQCIAALPLTIGAAGQAPAAQTVVLLGKLSLTGTVTDSTGAPAAGVTVNATQTSSAGGCQDATLAPPVSTTTDTMGRYSLLVDPGTYIIDSDPPAGASWPRLTEGGSAAVVVAADLVHDIGLPAGEVAIGTVYASDGATPLPMATINIFAVLCQSAPCPDATAPVLLARTQSDLNGQFRAVVPLQ
jgi:hypothetical protein